MSKPLIVVVPLGHEVYFPQFPGLREILTEKAGDFAACFSNDVGVVVTDYTDTVPKAFETVKKVKAMDPDGVFLLLTTYLPSAVAAPFAWYLDAPLILAAIQPSKKLDYAACTTFTQLVNDDICAMPEIAGAFSRLGRKDTPCLVANTGDKEILTAQVRRWEAAIRARAAFRYATFGYLGHTYEGMYDMNTDPTAFTAAFGSHVTMLEMDELKERADRAEKNAVEEKLRVIRDTFTIADPSCDPLTEPVRDGDLELSARMSVALDGLVKEHGLSALAYFYKGQPGTDTEAAAASLIVGNTLLTSSGIPLAGEADLKTAAAMLILSKLGAGGSFAELHPFDVEKDSVLVGHDGPHNIAISQGKPVLRRLHTFHGKPGSGVGVEFSIRNGPVTMLSINMGPDGRLRMVAAAGTSVEGEIPRTGNTNTHVRFTLPVREFLSRWCEAAPTHHFALGTGNHLEELRYFARITGLELTIIG